MQAVVLVELYSLFKSRRPPLQFSKNFEQVYQCLQIDQSTLAATSSTSPPRRNAVNHTLDGDDADITVPCKQRLLLACYALEQQHNLLFGRASSIGFPSVGFNLPFPDSQVRWDADCDLDFSALNPPHYARVTEALEALPHMTEESSEPHDSFQSMLMMACLCDPTTDVLEWADCHSDYSLPWAIEKSPRINLTFHTFALCKNTPVRHLLAVAGESWVMAEKLTTQAEYIDAQQHVRAWATESLRSRGTAFDVSKVKVNAAVRHALRILEIHKDFPRTGLLFQEWTLHLAAVVIWTYAYMVQRTVPHAPNAVCAETSQSPQELEQAITALAATGSAAITGWTEARCVLTWVRTRVKDIVPHTCGLISGSLDVLGKLLARGNEDGWF